MKNRYEGMLSWNTHGSLFLIPHNVNKREIVTGMVKLIGNA